jgi:hypothetical protein
MPGPAVWTGGSSSGGAGNATQENTLPTSPVTAPTPTSTEAASAPSSAPAVHNDENCNSRVARARRAFRDALRKL